VYQSFPRGRRPDRAPGHTASLNFDPIHPRRPAGRARRPQIAPAHARSSRPARPFVRPARPAPRTAAAIKDLNGGQTHPHPEDPTSGAGGPAALDSIDLEWAAVQRRARAADHHATTAPSQAAVRAAQQLNWLLEEATCCCCAGADAADAAPAAAAWTAGSGGAWGAPTPASTFHPSSFDADPIPWLNEVRDEGGVRVFV
jgi:hypothetical protein